MTRPKQVTAGILPPTPPPSQGILTTQSHMAKRLAKRGYVNN
ncbi:uncharacterized protein METZ01_LOCUS91210 [marine metagenome]|uniref:Uncharacterized protein n=1 Tax=marine metagenome TaxID=408172 RepID=A0A381VDC4_9ZZZZ